MDDASFAATLMGRSPLAAAVLEVFDHVFDDELLRVVYETNRGRCYEDTLTFQDLLRLTRDALVQHGGSAHQLFTRLERRKANPCDESSFYRKLANTPVAVSRAMLLDGTARLAALMPAAHVRRPLPACFDATEVVLFDGKKIKGAAKWLKPTRGFAGQLLGAKALVAVDARTGLALAMNDALDGLANDVPLVAGLLPQVYRAVPAGRPILSVCDRQFCDAATFARFASRGGDHYAVRLRKGLTFQVESSSVTRVRAESEGGGDEGDGGGGEVTDEVGTLFKGKQALRVRQVTLRRAGQEDVVVATDLLDRDAFPADDLLELYRARWGIEQVFQQVTETFSLKHLIGGAPKAILFQFAFCLLLYNLMHVVRAFVAEDGGVLASAVSMFFLFDDARRQLCAWAYYTDGRWPRQPPRDAAQMQRRLRELLKGSWDPAAYTKHADKKPRKPPGPKRRLVGGHSSVQRVLEGRAKVI